MTVIRPNSVSGINSITAQADEIKVFKSNGTQGGLIIGGANLNATTGISTLAALNVTGNVDISGVLTYQDVTNVDSLGIGTFRTGINVSGGQLDVGSNIKIGNAGVVTATSFVGDGSNLTGISAGTSLSGSTNNTVCTVTGANAIQGEANLTYDGTNLQLTTDANNEGIKIDGGVTYPVFEMTANRGAGNTIGKLISKWNGTQVASISFVSGSDATNKDDGIIYFNTASAGTATERLRISSNGNIGIGNRTSSPDQLLHVHTASGDAVIHVEAAADPKLRLRAHSGESIIQFADASSSNTGEINYVHSGDYLKFAVNAGERLRIDSNGKVSIASGAYGGGGVTPELYVRGTSGRQVKIHNTNAATCSVQLTNSASGEGEDHGMQFALLGGGGGYFKHHVNNATVLDAYSQVSGSGKHIMRVYNDGKIGQQSNSDCLMLSTSQDGTGSNYFLRGSKNSTQPGGGNDAVWIYEDGDIRNNNNSYGQQSDIKLKENIVDAGSQWDDIKNLKVRKFNFKASAGFDTHTQIGLIAQEAELVSPGLIKEVKDRVKTEEKNELGSISYKESFSETEKTKHVMYSVLYMKAIKCLQEAQARIETLEAKVAALEGS